MSSSNLTGFMAATALVVSGVLLSRAGPVDPPTGPVASTYKTLTEVEPRIAISPANTPGDETCLFRITAPGSYYLTGGITGVTGKDGVRIESGGVSIDLMGFTLAGSEESGQAIRTVGAFGDIAVRHGTITGWGEGGVILATGGRGFVIEDVRVSSCVGHGIDAGDAAIVRSCTAVYNSAYGIRVGQSGVVDACSAWNNGVGGIAISIGSVARGSTAGANEGLGFNVEAGATATECSAQGNQLDGFFATTSSVISRCSSSFNMMSGISVGAGSLILENACSENGRSGSGAGVHAFAPYNRIEGNHVTNNPIGFDVAAGRSLLVKNYATGNGVNFNVSGSNIVGTIVTTEAQMNAAANANVNVSF